MGFQRPGPSEIPDYVYHYTTQDGLLGILKDKKIWMTKIQYLNDSSEFSLAIEVLIKTLTKLGIDPQSLYQKAFGKIKSQTDFNSLIIKSLTTSPVYVASFSEEGDLLSQWRGYSEGNFAYSIKISGARLKAYSNKIPDGTFAKCEYLPEKHTSIIEEFVSEKIQQNLSDLLFAIMSDFLNIAPFIKHPGFHEEKEWRLAIQVSKDKSRFMESVRKGSSMLIPYIEEAIYSPNASEIEGIIVGPCPHPELSIESVKSALIKFEIADCVVTKSSIPYRNW